LDGGLSKESRPKERTYFEQASVAASAAQLEARFKLVNRILAEYQPTEILELAAGLSPRGLALTLADRQLKYVEVDLPDMAREKNKIIATLSQQLGLSPDNLQIRAGDAMGRHQRFSAGSAGGY
jgi:O-methyltransferase involved in polyketide biosynthesis